MKITRQAFAKTNIFLTVPGRLENGYHLIRSLIIPLALSDIIDIELETGFTGQVELPASAAVDEPAGFERDGREISCSTIVSEKLQEHLNFHRHPHAAAAPGAGGQPGVELIKPLYSGSNICIRAARLFLEQFKDEIGSGGARISITVHKRIPIGAGLGGGSADAAAVLCGLNALFGLSLTDRQLAEAGAKLGSDIPAAIYGRPVFIYGTGGKLIDLKNSLLTEFHRELSECGVVIVKPPYPVITETAYFGLGHRPELPDELAASDDFRTDPRALQLLAQAAAVDDLPQHQLSEFTHELTSRGNGGNSDARWGLFQNDFETSVFGRHPDLARLVRLLSAGGAGAAFLAGSGSSIIGLFATPQQASTWAERFCGGEMCRGGEFRGSFVETTSFRL